MKKPSSAKPSAAKSASAKKSSAAKPSLLQIIIDALEDLKAQNIVTLDVAQLTDVTDTLVIASGSSSRQVRALAQHAAEEAKKKGTAAIGVEGLDGGEWVLADFGDVVLHVMQPEIREFYDLEKLWQSPEEKTVAPKKAVATKTDKPVSTKATPTKTGKSVPVPEAEFVTQSDAAKARKAPGKPKTASSAAGTKKPAAKTAPPKAGVYAKTGTKKPAAPKLTATKKPAATKKPTSATKPVTAKKPVAAKPATKSTTKPAPKKPAARKPRSV